MKICDICFDMAQEKKYQNTLKCETQKYNLGGMRKTLYKFCFINHFSNSHKNIYNGINFHLLRGKTGCNKYQRIYEFMTTTNDIIAPKERDSSIKY